MRITFVLPGFRTRPVGGFLVVYRYANELARRGHRVSVVHPRSTEEARGLVDRLKAATWVSRKRARWHGAPPWFELDDSVESILVRDLREVRIPRGDAVVATATRTAEAVASYDAGKGAKLYLIQDYEDWIDERAAVDATWRLPMHKVVTSGWLRGIAEGLGVADEVTHIPPGVEVDVFRVRTRPGERNRLRVGLVAHRLPRKGTRFGVEALALVRETVPELEAVAFGTEPRPPSLPEWVRYVENPSRPELVELLNSLSIFVHTSLVEGWGLPACEALACGCALVAADSKGVRDYAVDGHTAVLVPPGSAAALADATLALIRDDERRVALAENGVAEINRFTWDRAADRLEELLRALVSR